MTETTFRCDGPRCTAVRGPSNHWLVAFIDADDDHSPIFWLRSWDDDTANNPNAKHVCGAACAHKLLDKYIDDLKARQ